VLTTQTTGCRLRQIFLVFKTQYASFTQGNKAQDETKQTIVFIKDQSSQGVAPSHPRSEYKTKLLFILFLFFYSYSNILLFLFLYSTIL